MCICDGLYSWLIYPYYGRFIQKVDFWTLFFFCFLVFMTICHIWVPLSQGLWLPYIPNSRKLVRKCLRYNSQCYIYSIDPHSGSIWVQNVSLDKIKELLDSVFFLAFPMNEFAFWSPCHSTTISRMIETTSWIIR